MMFNMSRQRNLARTMAPAIFALLMVGQAESSNAQTSHAPTSQPKTFSSAGEASEALFQAVRSHDEQALETILGAGKQVTSTGDDTEDTLEREHFQQKYQEMHRLVREPDSTTVLYIGAENWPFPIPLTSRNGRWSFDARTGMEEMLFRRIGENEATVLETCRTLVKTGAPGQARHGDKRFHGYYLRALGESPSTVAFVAYPAEYRSSGVMTFIVTKDGTVYERDLGPDTETLARAIKDRKPSSAWHAVISTHAAD